MQKNINSKTIIFIHGLFLTPKVWNEWKKKFENMGYTCHAPANPGHEGQPAKLRSNPDSNLGEVNFEDWVNNIINYIDNLPEKPIIVGHSMGGLVAQKLMQLNKVDAAVCISSAPPKGVITTKLSFAKSNLGLINPFKGNSIYYPTKKWFHYAFTNTLTKEQSDRIFEEQVVPESRNIPRQTLKKAGKIDFKRPHQPLLFISGKDDHIIPFTLNKSNFNKYKDQNSIKEMKVFENRDHFICGEKNWEEVADYVYSWLNNKY